jgi:L-ascorbate metabolism protein UlaG (beta-lactamase superfamily)
MKKWFFWIGIGLGLILTVIVALTLWNEYDETVPAGYAKNGKLKTIKSEWPGTPVDQRGRFVNSEYPFLMKLSNLLKWKFNKNPQSEEKKNDPYRLDVKDASAFLASQKDGILWLGHASFYIRLAGKGILIDPVFGRPSILNRYVDVPSQLGMIKRVDYVLISHDHRDHMDENSIKAIASIFPRAKFLAGLGMEGVLADWMLGNEIQTAGWFQQFSLPDEDVNIYFLPVRHWCQRGVFDQNERLWGGFVIQGAGKTIYFGGDSGYGRHYIETAALFPTIDYFLIGIGAYKPRWFMEPNHNSPEDALKAFQDSGAKVMVPMHYGTFDLSDEPPGEPLRLLNEGAKAAGISDKIKQIAIGESIEIGDDKSTVRKRER